MEDDRRDVVGVVVLLLFCRGVSVDTTTTTTTSSRKDEQKLMASQTFVQFFCKSATRQRGTLK
jgi:hypothetical protein